MSADISYGVEISYLSTGNLSLPAGLTGAMKSAKDLEKSVGGIGKSLGAGMSSGLDALSGIGDRIVSGLATVGVMAGVALAGGAMASLREGLKFDEFKENAIASLATIGTMLGKDVSFDQGIREGEDSFERLRVAAKKLPGTVKDSMGFMTALAPVTQGVENYRRENMASQGVAAAMALGVAQPVAARELSAMLAGNARHSMPLFAKMGLGDSKSFNALSSAARFDKVEAQFAKLGSSIEYYSHTMAGLKSAMADNLKNVAGVFAAPLYEKVKNALETSLTWFGKNEYQINEFAARLGKGVAWAFEAGRMLLFTYGPIALDFGERLYEGVKRAVEYLAPHLGQLAKLAGGLAIAGIGAKVASPALRAGASLAGPAMSAVGVAGGTVALAGAVALASAGVALGTIFVALTSALNPFASAAKEAWTSIQTHVLSIGRSLANIWSEVGPAIEMFAATYGTLMLKWLELVASLGDSVIKFISNMFEGIGLAIGAFVDKFPFLKEYLNGLSVKDAAAARRYNDGHDAYRGVKDAGETAKPPVHVTNNTNHITVKVMSNQDPNRIARAVAGVIKGELRNPRAAALNPAGRFSTQ